MYQQGDKVCNLFYCVYINLYIQSKRPTLIRDDEEKQEDGSEKPLEASAADTFQTFPDMDTLEQMYDGQKYKELPFVHIRCHKNNTRFMAYTADLRQIEYCVPKDFGFVNAAKRTDVAAQVAGVNMGQRLRNRNIRTIRVTVEGFNAAKQAGIKGLVQAGMTVVSLTDHTYVDWGWRRRAKKRPRPYNMLKSFLSNKIRYF